MPHSSELKKTPLYPEHIKLGARMVEFAGWEMPVQYESIIKEHEWVRNHCGVFDISHMGEFLVEGKDAFSFLQGMMTNDLALLKPGKSQYSCMCYENGTVVDDLIYYMESQEKFRLIVNASNREKDFHWLKEHIGEKEVSITDVSDERARIAIQGPETQKLLSNLVEIDLESLPRFHFAWTTFIFTSSGKKIPVFLANTGYTGEKGYELSCKAEDIISIWETLLSQGIKPIGLGARDSLRLEASYPLYGHEINDHITPIEASMSWVVKEKPGVEYLGKSVLLKQKKEGTQRKLVGLNLKKKGIMREGYKVFKGEEQIGYITSGGYSPTLKKSIALALLDRKYSEIGTEVSVQIRNKKQDAVVVKTPFYRSL